MRPKKVILCVDDEEQILSVQRFLLETHGYRVLTAQSGAEVLACFPGGAGVDLILADFSMPGITGAALAEKLKDAPAHVPVLLLGEPEQVGLHLADACLSKTKTTAAELLERVKVMSARKRGPRKGTPRRMLMVSETVAELMALAGTSV